MTTPDTSRRAPAELPPLIGGMGRGSRMPGKVERARDPRGTVRRLWGYLRRQRGALIITTLLVVLTSALNVISPYLLGLAIDSYVLRADLAGLAQISLSLLAVALATALLTWLQSFIMTAVAQRTVRDLRNDLFGRMQQLPLRFFDQRQQGDLMSRLTNDVETVNQVLADGVVQIVSGVLGTVSVVIVMLLLNPTLTLVSVLTVTVLTLLLNGQVAPRTRAGFRQQQQALGTLNGLIEETISGQRVVKAYGREPAVIVRFAGLNQELRHAATRAQIVAGFLGPMMNAVSNVSLAVVAGVGGWLAVGGAASVGTIASFINYTRPFGRPLGELATLYNALQSAVAGAERVFAIIDEPAEIDAPAVAAAPIQGEVVFADVRFGYAADVPVLHGISLHATPGQVVALVGPTGAGKTTIINLLTRFYEIDGGTITIDGRDLRQFPKAQLRQQLGIVLQESFLFAGTVRENIRYGRLAASDDEVQTAARLANADSFITRLPQGYDTPLTERAANISQGQRQMLAIARALLADPRILILDEATSSVDTRTEHQIQEATRRLMAGRTCFVIVHRLSTIRDADQILVIDRGRIVERGTHPQLLAQGGMYARMVRAAG